MFYLYSAPESFKQKFHNFLAKVIVFIGKCLGVGWIQKSLHGPFYTNAHRNQRFWCYLINFTEISVYCFIIYNELTHEEGLDDFLVGTFGKMSVICYYLLMISFLMTVMMQQRRFLKYFNFAYNLHIQDQLLFDANGGRSHNGLFTRFLIKTLFDITLICTMVVLAIRAHFALRTIATLLFLFLLPSSMVVYCFVGTTYFISLAYGLLLGQRAHEALKTASVHTSNVTTFYHSILTFVKKVHGTVQLSLLFLVTHAFLEFVIQVPFNAESERIN